ncbi:MAG: FRG domain-containing protein [Lachnospiraceae bacterium]|nr:FRG domain-containing protein [Lachnospiraceae bacterium]MBD5490185.1 FRG domain-containing protein [Lachnospiraceae bacterium]
MNEIKSNLRIGGTTYIEDYNFSNGKQVPIYEIHTVHGLNQIIGYAKFNNNHYGNVFYRGECKLHQSLIPSLFRGCKYTSAKTQNLNKLLHLIHTDDKLRNELKLSDADPEKQEIKIEGMLQHYGVPTRYIDVVDNHWIALWMGLHKTQNLKHIGKYYHYGKRELPLSEMLCGNKTEMDTLYQYILLIAVPDERVSNGDGIEIMDNMIVVDLRKALPSIFLRPHAQHGLVLRNRGKDSNNTSFYDVSNNVIGILKIRIDRADEWLGNGQLLTQDNLFPSPGYDYGYDLLLSRNDIFLQTDFEITKYN